MYAFTEFHFSRLYFEKHLGCPFSDQNFIDFVCFLEKFPKVICCGPPRVGASSAPELKDHGSWTCPCKELSLNIRKHSSNICKGTSKLCCYTMMTIVITIINNSWLYLKTHFGITPNKMKNTFEMSFITQQQLGMWNVITVYEAVILGLMSTFLMIPNCKLRLCCSSWIRCRWRNCYW